MGVGFLMATDGVLGTDSITKNIGTLVETSADAKTQTNSRASLLTVKVYYTMMAQYTDMEEEVFVLQSPAAIQELINTVIVRHPSMAEMMNTMLILLNGVAAKSTTSLNNGDTVQFIPLSAGG